MQSFAKGIIILDYGLNIQSYIQNCINKAKPQMQCNGKCGMYKKLEKEEKGETSANTNKAEKAAEQFIKFESVVLEQPTQILSKSLQYFAYNNCYSHLITIHLLRPPIS